MRAPLGQAPAALLDDLIERGVELLAAGANLGGREHARYLRINDPQEAVGLLVRQGHLEATRA